MSLEDQLKRLNDNLENLIPALGGALSAPAAIAPAADPPAKPAKKKAAKTKTAKSDKSDTPAEVDRPKVMNEIVEFIKGKIKGADDRKEMQTKVSEVRDKYGVELVGDLPDDKLLPFQEDIQAALA